MVCVFEIPAYMHLLGETTEGEGTIASRVGKNAKTIITYTSLPQLEHCCVFTFSLFVSNQNSDHTPHKLHL